jgi:hypothetical protein
MLKEGLQAKEKCYNLGSSLLRKRQTIGEQVNNA